MSSKLTVFIQVLVCFNLFTICFSCANSSENENVKDDTEKTTEKSTGFLKYARGFEIEEKKDFKVITLKDAWRGEETSYQYVLYKNTPPAGYENATFIKVPIKKIACMSLTHVTMLEELGQLNSIVAISGCDFANSKAVRNKINRREIKEAGNYQKLNYEMLIDENPDVVMVFGIDQSSTSNINKLKELGFNVVLNAEYMELHPLGKAEWIKYIAAFYDMDKEAATFFDQIEKEYLALTGLTKDIKKKPTVFVGMPWNGSWYVPGGKTFVAQLFKDAGANYLWKNNEERGSFVKSKEIILDEALDANYWMNQGSYLSIEDIIKHDPKFENFEAVKLNQLYNNNKRLNEMGGNDYWETGVVSPHIVLKDLIEIFHPELLDHELYYYHQLK